MKFQEFSEFISGYLILKSGSTACTRHYSRGNIDGFYSKPQEHVPLMANIYITVLGISFNGFGLGSNVTPLRKVALSEQLRQI